MSALSTSSLPSFALLGTVTVASVLGSLHCAAMCGPLISACHAGAVRPFRTELAYHLTRGVSYACLGAVSGALGAALDWAGQGAGVVRLAAVVSGLLVVLAGVFWLAPGLGVRGLPLGTALGRVIGRGLVQLRRRRPTLRATLLGFLTPALPCGYLYAFALSAAGTGSPEGGALLMVAFWLGTLPALILVGAVLGRLSQALRTRLPLLTGIVLIAMGALGVLGRGLGPLPSSSRSPAQALGDVAGGTVHEHAACH